MGSVIKNGQFVRACKDYAQAYELCKAQIQWARGRQAKDAGIARQLNDEQPFRQDKLNAAAQSWRSNFSTGWLSSILYRAIPNYIQVVQNSEVLSRAELSDNTNPQNERISSQFQILFTRMLRRWKGWNDFCYRLVCENIAYGSALAVMENEFDWRPTFLRRDFGYLPDGSGQTSEQIPFFIRIKYYLVHELAYLIQDPESATDAGWEIDNVVEAINAAKPEALRTRLVENERRYEDSVRQTNVSTSFANNVKKVKCYELFITEYATKKVSHYIMADDIGGRGLFCRLDQFNSMDECCTPFTVEPADGSYYGSKGIGRALYNMSVKKNQATMLMLDNLYLGGLLMLKGTAKGKNKTAITVQSPVIVVSEDFEVEKNELKVDVESYQKLDDALNTIAEIRAGVYMPAQTLSDTPSDRRTASEINYVASIEQTLKDATTRRFWGQFQSMVYMIQKRVCTEDNIQAALQVQQAEDANALTQVLKKMKDYFIQNDQTRNLKMADSKDEAIQFLVDMLRFGATPEQLAELGQCPPQEITTDEVIQNAQNIDMAYQRYAGNPMINQVELIKRDLASKLGNDSINNLLLTNQDVGEQAWQSRQQIMESQDLMDGVAIPVAPQDDDLTHLGVMANLIPGITQAAQQAMQAGQINSFMPQLIALYNHAQAHLGNAQDKKINPKLLQPFIQQTQQIQQMLQAVQGGVPLPPNNPTMSSVPPQPNEGMQPPKHRGHPITGHMTTQQDDQRHDQLHPTEQMTDDSVFQNNPHPIPPSQGKPFSRGPVNLNTNVS
jgi:hypothetical protein